MRNLADITALVQQSTLSDWVKEKSIKAFTYLAEAEAHTHGTSIDAIQFHEVGAIDSIIDTVGSVLALDLLGVREVYCSTLPFSSGTVKCAHGILPVPPPATLRLMIGVPVGPAPAGATGELVTPTGISLVKALTTAFQEPPAFVATHTGVGAGTKDFAQHANVVRVAIGSRIETPRTAPLLALEVEDVVQLETNLDDLNPQVVGFVIERLLAGLALDVWTQAIHMKKNRPGILLSVLCLPQNEAEVTKFIYRETTTLGIRRRVMQRSKLERAFRQIELHGERVDIKFAMLDGQVVNAHPEYEHCKVLELLCFGEPECAKLQH
ncbi:hypothetical protein PINS_up002625 [Pythium insidiosum]|nr:hypothetical protein PINS_up002625 [Pythium insidiosum]